MIDEYRAERIKKMNAFIERGINPFSSGHFEKQPSQVVISLPVGQHVQVAGRIVLRIGKSIKHRPR